MSFAVLALHYWAGAGSEFSALLPHLPAGIRLLAPDLPGFGRQPVPAGFDYSMSSYANWVAEFLHQNAVADFTLLGHSMGGKIALVLAARHPPGLRRLVLLAPSPPPGEPMPPADRAAAHAAFGQRLAAADTLHRITQRPLTPAQHTQALAANLATTRPAWEAWLDAGSREDITPLLARMAVPCHLLAGANDRAIHPETQRQRTLPYLPPGTRLDILPGCGHLLPLEAPAAVTVALS